MGPKETKILEKEINEYIFVHMEELHQSASVRAYVCDDDVTKQYLRVNISSVYIVNIEVDYGFEDFKLLLSHKSKDVITRKLVKALIRATTGDKLVNDVMEDHKGLRLAYEDEEIIEMVNTDKEFLIEIKDNLLKL